MRVQVRDRHVFTATRADAKHTSPKSAKRIIYSRNLLLQSVNIDNGFNGRLHLLYQFGPLLFKRVFESRHQRSRKRRRGMSARDGVHGLPPCTRAGRAWQTGREVRPVGARRSSSSRMILAAARTQARGASAAYSNEDDARRLFMAPGSISLDRTEVRLVPLANRSES